MAEPSNPVYAELERIGDNVTALHATRAPAWVSEPSMRGTSSILYTCLLTIFACICTALHLNVPKSGSGFWRLLFTKLCWVLAALFTPEIVVFYAASQFIRAWGLVKHMRQLYKSREGTGEDVDPDKVTYTSCLLPPGSMMLMDLAVQI